MMPAASDFTRICEGTPWDVFSFSGSGAGGGKVEQETRSRAMLTHKREGRGGKNRATDTQGGGGEGRCTLEMRPSHPNSPWITSCGDMPSKKVVLVRCWSEGLRDLGSASCQKSHIARERKNLASNPEKAVVLCG